MAGTVSTSVIPNAYFCHYGDQAPTRNEKLSLLTQNQKVCAKFTYMQAVHHEMTLKQVM